MSDKTDLEKTAEAMKKMADKMLDDAKSIHAPCKNAYKDSRDGLTSCACWRCRPQESSR